MKPVEVSQSGILLVVALYAASFIGVGCVLDTPAAIIRGLVTILTTRDTLITDYIGLAGIGATFVNAGLLTLIVCAIYVWAGARINGTAVACLFLVLGFGLFGKNLLNVWCVVLGVFLYSTFKKQAFAANINTAFFGTALAPFFSEIVFSTVLPGYASLPLGIVTSVLIGFVLTPVAAQVFHAHMGHSLYNMGITAGIIGTLMIALYHHYGFVADPVFVWSTGNNLMLGAILVGGFVALIAVGCCLDRDILAKQMLIIRQTGQAPSDFIAVAGFGPTLVNMGLTGVMGMGYVLLVGSDLNGPTIGAVLSIAGFAAAGKHPRNILPIMLGVFIGSLAKSWSAHDPSSVLAALFGTTLAPIAGRFGWRWGLLAGFLHASAVRSVGDLHAGLVLYSNGFAAGLVAIVLAPTILAIRRRPDTGEADRSDAM